MEKDNSLTKVLVFGLILALCLLVGQSYMLSNINHEENSDKTISVSGLSEMSVDPDEAVIYFVISSEDVDAKVAQENNAQISLDVISALKAQGVLDENIETTSYNLYENNNYDYDYNGIRKIMNKTYVASHYIKVKISDLDKVGSLVAVGIGAGATEINNIEYTLSDEKEKEVRAQALEKAIEAGSEKAKSMTDVMNVKLGDVVSISESNYYYTPYTYVNAKMTLTESSSMDSNYFAPENVDVRSTVSLVFEIEN